MMIAFLDPTGPIIVIPLFLSLVLLHLCPTLLALILVGKGSLESDQSCRGRQSDPLYSDFELLDVLGTGAQNVRARPSAIWKDRFRSADPVSSVVGSRKRRVDSAVTIALPGKGALPSRGNSGG